MECYMHILADYKESRLYETSDLLTTLSHYLQHYIQPLLCNPTQNISGKIKDILLTGGHVGLIRSYFELIKKFLAYMQDYKHEKKKQLVYSHFKKTIRVLMGREFS